MKKTLLTLICLLSICLGNLYAQRGDVGLGLRPTPDGGGFTGKFFLDRNIAIEGQLNAGVLYNGKSVTAVGLIEYHIVLPDPSWRVFFGGGIHFGTWDKYDNGDTRGIFGIDGIGGIEYLFKSVPIGISFDFKPAINFVSDVDFFPHNIIGLAGRIYLSRPKPTKM